MHGGWTWRGKQELGEGSFWRGLGFDAYDDQIGSSDSGDSSRGRLYGFRDWFGWWLSMRWEVVWKKTKPLEANQAWSEGKTGENRWEKVGSRELSLFSSLPPLFLLTGAVNQPSTWNLAWSSERKAFRADRNEVGRSGNGFRFRRAFLQRFAKCFLVSAPPSFSRLNPLFFDSWMACQLINSNTSLFSLFIFSDGSNWNTYTCV